MHVFIETSLKRTYMRSSFKTKINNISGRCRKYEVLTKSKDFGIKY